MLQQILRAPALKAILIQLLAFPLMLLLVYGLARAGIAMSLLAVAGVQGVLAAAITWRAGLARWWCAIGLLFAPALLGASRLDRFFTVALPLARPGFITAAVLSFAHTVGEFGIVLMLGGNIPGVTRVVSVQIYDHVEAMEYAQAHWLAGGMVAFAFVVLVLLSWLQPREHRHASPL